MSYLIIESVRLRLKFDDVDQFFTIQPKYSNRQELASHSHLNYLRKKVLICLINRKFECNKGNQFISNGNINLTQPKKRIEYSRLHNKSMFKQKRAKRGQYRKYESEQLDAAMNAVVFLLDFN